MRNRTERRSGPLSRDELESLLERGYGAASRRWIGKVWGLGGDASAEEVCNVLESVDTLEPRYSDVSEMGRVALQLVAGAEGRIRGENLRREMLLNGLGDQRDTLRELMERGLLIPVPAGGEVDLDLEGQLEQGTYLQRDVTLPTIAMDFVSGIDIDAVSNTISSDVDVDVEFSGNTGLLELNILHVGRLLLDNALRLNKSGAPNRRSLVRFARGIVFPGEVNEAGEDELDLSDGTQLDYISFVLGLAGELGIVRHVDDGLEADADALHAYFTASNAKRDRQLLEAFRDLRYWNELRSTRLDAKTDEGFDEHVSLAEPTGESLVAIRGYVISVIKRARFRDWIKQSAIRAMCLKIDLAFLEESIRKAAPESTPRDYVDAFLQRGLRWLGVLDVGEANGSKVVRFTQRGLAVLGMGEHPEDQLRPDQCMVVQPNLEIMVFLDAAPMSVLYEVYRMAERRKLSDRVATFALTPESVQRGYSLGLSADRASEILAASCAMPVAESIGFQLKDWERQHLKLRVFASGVLIRHPDPDGFDLAFGQFQHDCRDDIEFIHLGPTSAFASEIDGEALKKFIDRNKGVEIDYLGEVPPSLHFVDPLTVMVDPVRCDVVTWWELHNIAQEIDDDALPGTRFYELHIDLIQKRWPDNPLQSIVDFLNARTEGGLPPGQYLTLRAALVGPASAEIRSETTVIVLESADDGDIFERVEEVEGHVLERLGPRAFEVRSETLPELREVLAELGIRV